MKDNFVKDFVEGRILPEQFKNALYTDPSYESYFGDVGTIPPYTSANYTIYNFLLDKNYSSLDELIDTKDLLSKFLSLKGITHSVDQSELNRYELILKAQPKWLDIPTDYIDYLLKDTSNLDGKELITWLKKAISDRFICLSSPPKWLQSPNWPIDNNIPYVFVGQLDISKVSHDTSFLYIFYNPTLKVFKQIIQSL